jgi:hypothetical protein
VILAYIACAQHHYRGSFLFHISINHVGFTRTVLIDVGSLPSPTSLNRAAGRTVNRSKAKSTRGLT